MISSYDNGSYSVSTHQEFNSDKPLVFFANTTEARGGVASSNNSFVFGISPNDAERLSQIVGREGSRIRRVSEKRFGLDVITFQVDVPKFGKYAFSFREITDTDNSKQASQVVETKLQLVGYSVNKSVGHIYRNQQQQITLGNKKPKDSLDDWLYGIRGVETLVGPISYDTEGYPKTVGFAENITGKDPYSLSGITAEITSIRPLRIRLREDEICFAEITAKIPERAKVNMINPTGEVYEIRGRQLVKVVDGNAVSVSKNAGYRAPPSSAFYFAGLGFAAVVLLTIYVWFRNR